MNERKALKGSSIAIVYYSCKLLYRLSLRTINNTATTTITTKSPASHLRDVTGALVSVCVVRGRVMFGNLSRNNTLERKGYSLQKTIVPMVATGGLGTAGFFVIAAEPLPWRTLYWTVRTVIDKSYTRR